MRCLEHSSTPLGLRKQVRDGNAEGEREKKKTSRKYLKVVSLAPAEQTLNEYEEGEAERKRACSAATGEPCSRVAPTSLPPSSTSISCSHEERVIGPLLQVVRTCFWIMPLWGRGGVLVNNWRFDAAHDLYIGQ